MRGIKLQKTDRGAALILALTFLSVLMIMTSVFLSNVISSSNFEATFEAQTRSLYIAEAGLNHAMWKLGQLGKDYTGESGLRFADGRFDISITNGRDNQKKVILCTARLDGSVAARTERKVRAIVTLGNPQGGGSKVTIESWEKLD